MTKAMIATRISNRIVTNINNISIEPRMAIKKTHPLVYIYL